MEDYKCNTCSKVFTEKRSLVRKDSLPSKDSQMRISATSVRRILHKELQMHLYKIMFAQELNENDLETRRALCLEIQQNVRMDALVLYSDEADFHLCGTVNKQNFRYWAESNPRSLRERPLHCLRVTVWCAIARFGIWGPYFLEEENVVATVNSDRYCKMLENFLKPRLNEREDQHQLSFNRMEQQPTLSKMQ